MTSLDDLFELAAPPSAAVEKWARAELSDAALSIEALFMLGYGSIDIEEDDDETHEAIAEWSETARARALARICSADEAAALAWCIAAARDAWTEWRDALASVPAHSLARVEAQMNVAIDPSASREALVSARTDTAALPTRTSPPPYAGHFYGGLQHLLDARLASNAAERSRELAESLSFFCVSPTGHRRAADVAALRR